MVLACSLLSKSTTIQASMESTYGIVYQIARTRELRPRIPKKDSVGAVQIGLPGGLDSLFWPNAYFLASQVFESFGQV